MKVLIGTPSYTGQLHAFYVDSLINTIKVCSKVGIDIYHLFVCFDALVQRARNDLFKIAYNDGFDYLFFIDSDMVWNPQDFLRLINHRKDIVLGAYRQKTDEREVYTFRVKENPKIGGDLVEIDSGGFGFMCISKETIKKMYETAPEYTNGDIKNRLVSSVEILEGEFTGEDILFCKKWAALGGEVFLDKKIALGHIGEKIFGGDVNKLFELEKDK